MLYTSSIRNLKNSGKGKWSKNQNSTSFQLCWCVLPFYTWYCVISIFLRVKFWETLRLNIWELAEKTNRVNFLTSDSFPLGFSFPGAILSSLQRILFLTSLHGGPQTASLCFSTSMRFHVCILCVGIPRVALALPEFTGWFWFLGTRADSCILLV